MNPPQSRNDRANISARVTSGEVKSFAPEQGLSCMQGPRIPDADRSDLTLSQFRTWKELVDIARHCPSPHNVQPWKIELIDENNAKLYVDGKRTFPFTDYTGSFILSAMSMFALILQIAAQNKGIRLQIDVNDVKNLDLQSPKSLFATLRLTKDDHITPHNFSDEDLLRRKTSRKENLVKPVPRDVLGEIESTAREFGHSLFTTDNPKVIDKVLRRDIKALFHDLNVRGYFGELKPMLKVGSKEHALDGLHYKPMNIPRLQFALMKHFPLVLKLPIVDTFAANAYRRKLGHCQELGFISGKFWDREDALQAGKMLINMWLKLSQHDLHIHPFGNLVTNVEARKEVEQMLGIKDLWFVFRVGYTDTPETSQRLSVAQLVK